MAQTPAGGTSKSQRSKFHPAGGSMFPTFLLRTARKSLGFMNSGGEILLLLENVPTLPPQWRSFYTNF